MGGGHGCAIFCAVDWPRAGSDAAAATSGRGSAAGPQRGAHHSQGELLLT